MLFAESSPSFTNLSSNLASHLTKAFRLTPPESASLAHFITVMIANGSTSMDDLDQELEELLGALHDTSFVPWIFDNLDKLTQKMDEKPDETMGHVAQERRKAQPTSRLFANALSAVSRRSVIDLPRKVRLERMEKRKESEDDFEQERGKKRGMPYPPRKPSSLTPTVAVNPTFHTDQSPEQVIYRPLHHQPSSATVCSFWPNCTRQGCRFYHPPSKMCTHWPNCRNPNCPFMHPEAAPVRMCKWGQECTNANCTFGHPEATVPPCKFGEYCKNRNCTFYHAPASNYAATSNYSSNYGNASNYAYGQQAQGETMCRFDVHCNNPNCAFVHSVKKQASTGHLSQRVFAVHAAEKLIPKH